MCQERSGIDNKKGETARGLQESLHQNISTSLEHKVQVSLTAVPAFPLMGMIETQRAPRSVVSCG